MSALRISLSEFASAFKACTPPGGWSKKLAVAFSGGPDSTCLLFLLQNLINSKHHLDNLPLEIQAITINHQLQDVSAAHADHCSTIARSLGVAHHIRTIKWGENNFPSLSDPTQNIETVARTCRYSELFSCMQQNDMQTLAQGHHLDDQVETMLMRQARGSAPLGFASMRPCRRWGMGLTHNRQTSLGWFGAAGMDAWIARPLLSFTKEAIINTCRHYDAKYVVDPTNSQPSLTIRNSIRANLKQRPEKSFDPANSQTDSRRPAQQSASTHTATSLLRTAELLMPHLENDSYTKHDLYNSVTAWGNARDEVERQVELLLESSKLPSPLSTFCVKWPLVHDCPEVPLALVLRILRYVSPLPWGSYKAEANRSRNSLERISQSLWGKDPSNALPFTVGGQVLWQPVKIHTPQSSVDINISLSPSTLGNVGWLAARLPPMKYRQEGVTELDVTDLLKSNTVDRTITILWDCRFNVTFHMPLMKQEIKTSLELGTGRIRIVPRNRYFEPIAQWERTDPASVPEQMLASSPKQDCVHYEFVRTLARI